MQNSQILWAFLFIALAIKGQSHALQEFSSVDSASSVSEAIVDFIQEFYIANKMTFEFIIYGQKSEHIHDVYDAVARQLGHYEMPSTSRYIMVPDEWDHTMNQSAVILTPLEVNLQQLYKSTQMACEQTQLTNIAPKKFKFLIYCEELTTIQSLRIFLRMNVQVSYNCPASFESYAFFITNEANDVVLSASEVYSEHACRMPHASILNRYDKASGQWIQKLENFDHHSNFHGCLLTFTTAYSGLLYIEDYSHKNAVARTNFLNHQAGNSVKFGGFLHEILTVIGRKVNFSFHYANLKVSQLSIYFKYSTTDLMDDMHYYSELGTDIKMYYLITQNDLYNNFEKMLLPFDTLTWTLLLLTMVFTFGTIFALRVSPRWIRVKLFGTGIYHPAYNALGIFFGISQLRLPSENFSRFILLLFIWFCLIFRTCYQSMMFEYMTSDMRKPLPRSIDDLREMNYTIVVHVQSFYYFEEQINGRSTNPPLILKSFSKYLQLYEDALFEKFKDKYAFFVREDTHNWMNVTHKRSLPIMDNEEKSKSVTITTPKNNLVVNSFDKILKQWIPAGIDRHFFEYGKWLIEDIFVQEHTDPRRILSLSDLGYGFVLWLAACFGAFTVFMFEINSLRLKRMRRKLIGLFYFLKLIRTRMVDYHDKW